MSSDEGAFVDGCRFFMNQYWDEQSKKMKDLIDHPEKYPELKNASGRQILEWLCADYQAVVDLTFGGKDIP